VHHPDRDEAPCLRGDYILVIDRSSYIPCCVQLLDLPALPAGRRFQKLAIA